jgi:hypothetical protein
MFGRASRGGRKGSESREDGVGEEIDVEDWWEELGDGQTEPVRSQVREESSGEGSGRVLNFEGGGVYHWQGGFERHYKIGAERVKNRKKSLDVWNFRPLAIVMAEIFKI